jgi:hypothetical protein
VVPATLPAASPEGPRDTDASYRIPAPERLVAIGDLHGDLGATRRVLRLAGAIDAGDAWVGGKLVIVQTGDQIDRGDDDRAIIELFDSLHDAAEAHGGRVISLNGNHETMNVALDLRYVTSGAFTAFAGMDERGVPPDVLARFEAPLRGRVAAFFPGGAFARRLAKRDVVVMVGDTVFVHGGVTERDVKYGLGRLNREVRAWMQGGGTMPEPIARDDGPVWSRVYSDDTAPLDCAGLTATLALLGAKRMVVGHTPHTGGITPGCDARVYRIDTGIARYYGGPAEALEIRGGQVAVLRVGGGK